jgi:hypothetical protein
VVSYRLPVGVPPPAGLGSSMSPDGSVRFTPEDLTAALHALTGWALENAVTLVDLRIECPSLEDVYLGLTGGERERPGDEHLESGSTAEGARR